MDDKIIMVETKMLEMHTAPAANQTNESSGENEQEKRVHDRTKLIMCMDSNSRHLGPIKLSDLDSTKHKECCTLSQVSQIVSRNIEYSNLKYVFIMVGCKRSG